MSCTVAADSPARALQSQIDVLQRELYERVTSLFADGNVKKNEHYTARHKVITDAICEGKLPRTFWADAIIAALSTPEAGSTTANNNDNDSDRLLGVYDAQLLRNYLEDMNVLYTAVGVRVVLRFKPNPFFEETELWGEEEQFGTVKGHSHGNDREERAEEKNENNEEEEEGEGDCSCYFSGITWKPGHGPDMGDDDDNDNDDDMNADKQKPYGNSDDATRKRSRSSANSTATRGWSFLDVFSKMLPHPADDEEFASEDEEDEDFEEAVEKWEEEMDDRRELMLLLVEDVWVDPVAAYVRGRKTETNAEESYSAVKKIRTD